VKASFDIEALYMRIDKQRRSKRLQWREVARQAQVHASLFSRMGLQSLAPNVDNLVRLLLWLGETDITAYIRQPSDTEEGTK
jgi:hypothetical protein